MVTPLDTVTDFVDGMARAMCGWQFRCCNAPEIISLGFGAYRNQSDCVLFTKIVLNETFAVASVSVGQRRLSLDPAVAAVCLKAFETGGCNPGQELNSMLGLQVPLPSDILAACQDPFVGKVPVGGQCFLSDECAPGNRCLSPGDPAVNGLGATTPNGGRLSGTVGAVSSLVGVCYRYQKEGELCRQTEECDPAQNLYCRRMDFRCARPAAEGEPCISEGDVTRPVIACNTAAGLHCGGGICRRQPRDGEPCLTQDVWPVPCDPNVNPPLACVGSQFNGSGLCKSPGRAGAACGGSGLPPCDNSLSCLGSAANSIGTCGSPPGLGQTCAIDFRCAAPAVCDTSRLICVTLGSARSGSTCSSNLDCESLQCTFDGNSGGFVCLSPQDVPVVCSGSNASPTMGGFGIGGQRGGI